VTDAYHAPHRLVVIIINYCNYINYALYNYYTNQATIRWTYSMKNGIIVRFIDTGMLISVAASLLKYV
jgi:hypothetical protein